jgi:hypothetical protein
MKRTTRLLCANLTFALGAMLLLKAALGYPEREPYNIADYHEIGPADPAGMVVGIVVMLIGGIWGWRETRRRGL